MKTLYEDDPLAQAKLYSGAHIAYSTPEEAGQIAQNIPVTEQERASFSIGLFKKFGTDVRNKTVQKLLLIQERSQVAHENLSKLGYIYIRHLQSEGITIPEIARDLNFNPLDIMAYMSSHPNAKTDASIDATACADAKIRDFLYDLQHNPPSTKFEADRKNIQYKVLLEQVKRISADWAILATNPITKDANGGGFNLNMTINNNSLNTDSKSQIIDAKVIESLPEEVTEDIKQINETYQLEPPTDQAGEYVDPLKQEISHEQNYKWD